MYHINLHTHTVRCHHARGTEREMIEAAIRAGIDVLGFSDHSPQFSDDRALQSVRMSVEEAPGYVSVIRDFAEEYRNDVKIYVGFEAEYLPQIFQPLRELCGTLDADYLIMGQHCLAYADGLSYEGVGARIVGGRLCSPIHTLKSYVDTLIAGMETGCFTYVCHPDMYYAADISDAEYRREYSRLCIRARELDVPLEVNNLGFTEKRNYPSDRFFSLVREFGNRLIVGVDAHTPEQIDVAHIEATLEYAEKTGLEIVEMPELRAPWKHD